MMGGRSARDTLKDDLHDYEGWIREVSDSRLASYERMLASPSAATVRADGETYRSRDTRNTFRDLLAKERLRRGKL